MRVHLLLLCLIPALSAFAQDTPEPTLSGYITHVDGRDSFEVNNHFRVTTSSTTTAVIRQTDSITHTLLNFDPYIGQRIDLYGKLDNKKRTLNATRVVVDPPDRSPVSGTAIINGLPQKQPSNNADRFLRADGYIMLLPAKVVPKFHDPLSSSTPVSTNLWISYHGTFSDDSILILDRADFSQNRINHDEEKLRKKHDYDPSQVDKDANQSGASKFFLGVDPKKIAPYQDAAMQSRLDRIGAGLIPAYQKNLSADDVTRIDFRFYLVKKEKMTYPMGLQNGIILVPYKVMEGLQDDSQLASILAYEIAYILEKQEVHNVSLARKSLLAGLAGDAIDFALPGVGAATSLTTMGINHHTLTQEQLQDLRVSLSLMHDAKYDLVQAPVAWHILAAAHSGKSLDETKPTSNMDGLYRYLDMLWHNPPAM